MWTCFNKVCSRFQRDPNEEEEDEKEEEEEDEEEESIDKAAMKR
jgi:hypothetical protein